MSSNQTSFTSVTFYGSKGKRQQKAVQENVKKRVEDFEKHPLPKLYNGGISGPTSGWRMFYRQQEAFDYARRSKSKDLHVFAYESDAFDHTKAQGQRMYVAVGYHAFWHVYSQLTPSQRHHYEVIPEGSVCKLYFDLEFYRENNPSADGPAMTLLVVEYVSCWLEHVYKLKVDTGQVLVFDASTDSKFSRHLIFTLPDAAFKNNVQVGNFILYILGKLLKYLKEKKSEDDTKVESSEELGQSGTDSGEKGNVHRQVKQGDTEHQVNPGETTASELITSPGEENDGGTRTERGETGDRITALIESFGLVGLEKLMVNNKDGDRILFCDTGVYTKNRNFRLYLSSKLGKNNPLVVSPDNCFGKPACDRPDEIFFRSLICNVSYDEKLKILTFESKNGRRVRTLTPESGDRSSHNASLEGYSSSPYPEVDAFIGGLLTRDGVKGSIRHWTYFSKGELLLYDIAYFRWCHNVQRQHKSNNIMYVADLLRGVYYQKCHDPECRAANYKSPDEPLPDHVLPANYFKDDEDFPEQVAENSVNGQKIDVLDQNETTIRRNGAMQGQSEAVVGPSGKELRKDDLVMSGQTEVKVTTPDLWEDEGSLTEDDLLQAVDSMTSV